MTSNEYTEDFLVQKTTAEYMKEQLSWDLVYAYNTEDFGPDSLLGRKSDREVVLTRPLLANLKRFNPGLPQEAYDHAVRQITSTVATQSMAITNREKYDLIKDGVPVTFSN